MRDGGIIDLRHYRPPSVLHAITTDVVQHEIKRDVEEHLLSSGLEYTAHELGDIISGVLGRTIAVEQIDADTYLGALFNDADQSNLQHQVRVLRAISARYSSHDFVGILIPEDVRVQVNWRE